MKIKAITTDIDGTLLTDDEKIIAETKEILIDAQKNGIKLILASGRNEEEMLDYAYELRMDEFEGILISSNGAFSKNISTNEVYFDEELLPYDSKIILEHISKFEIVAMIFMNGKLYCENYEKGLIKMDDMLYNIILYESELGNYEIVEVDSLKDFIDVPIKKILTAGDKEYLYNNHEKIAETLKNRYTCQFTGDQYFEFINKNANKGEAMKSTLDKLGISLENTIAFGDHNNDVEMLKFAKIGVGMEDSTEYVKENADIIAKSNNDNGIYHTLKRYL